MMNYFSFDCHCNKLTFSIWAAMIKFDHTMKAENQKISIYEHWLRLILNYRHTRITEWKPKSYDTSLEGFSCEIAFHAQTIKVFQNSYFASGQ